MFTLKGDFGNAVFANNVDSQGRVNTRYMSLNTDASLNFFRKLSIVKTDIIKNEMGLFSFQKASRLGKVRFASLTTPRHLFSKRKSGCVWNPKGGMSMNVSEISLDAIEYNGEQCPDVFYDECLEAIFGRGREVRDFFATAEGKRIFSEMVTNIYTGLGNSFYDLVWYGKHPLIAQSDAEEWYSLNDEEWADYKDQQEATGGIMTMVDWLKAEGLTNMNVEIDIADISEDHTAFIGDAQDLFKRVLKAQSPAQKMASKRTNVGLARTIILCDSRIFEKYEDELILQHGDIPAMFHYKLNGKFCEKVGCDGNTTAEGVLLYKGHKVVRMDEWENFNTMTGTDTFRVLAVTPGVFGIGYDTAPLSQFEGFGLAITQKLDAPHQGMIYMDTTFKLGMSIVDPDYLVNASVTFVPS